MAKNILKNPETGEWRRKTIVMFVSFIFCIVQAVADQFFKYRIDYTIFFSFLVVGGGATAGAAITNGLAGAAALDAMAATYAAAGFVRRNLVAAGFAVERRPGVARGEDPSIHRHQVRSEQHRRTQVHVHLRGVAVIEQPVGLHVGVDRAEGGGRLGRPTGSGHA